MTIRKKILLFSALALGAFLAAVYLVSRFALLNGFARLENNYVRENIHHLQNEMQNEQSRLEIMARDYAQWDRTYAFMETRDPDYARTELTDDTFKIIRINVFALLDSSGRIVFHKSVGDWALGESDLRAIAGVPDSAQPRRVDNSGMNGILELRGRLLLVAYQPILTSRGAGRPRGKPPRRAMKTRPGPSTAPMARAGRPRRRAARTRPRHPRGHRAAGGERSRRTCVSLHRHGTPPPA